MNENIKQRDIKWNKWAEKEMRKKDSQKKWLTDMFINK